MSHYTVMVINTNGINDIEGELQPFHEYECTGIKDRYVKRIPSTYYTKEKYLKDISSGNIDVNDSATFLLWLTKYNGLTLDGEYNELVDDVVYEYTNPNSRWDWYQIGGRWEDKLVSKRTGERCDSVTKGDLDIDTILNEAVEKAIDRWELVAFTVGTTLEGKVRQPEKSFQQIHLELSSLGDEDVKSASKEYDKQEVVKKFNTLGESVGLFTPIKDFDKTLEEYVRVSKNRELATFAVVLDGEWFEKGKMGWFAIIDNTEEESDQWDDTFYERFIEPLPDHALLTIVDCHI